VDTLPRRDAGRKKEVSVVQGVCVSFRPKGKPSSSGDTREKSSADLYQKARIVPEGAKDVSRPGKGGENFKKGGVLRPIDCKKPNIIPMDIKIEIIENFVNSEKGPYYLSANPANGAERTKSKGGGNDGSPLRNKERVLQSLQKVKKSHRSAIVLGERGQVKKRTVTDELLESWRASFGGKKGKTCWGGVGDLCSNGGKDA